MMVLIFLQDVPLPNSNGLFGAGVKAGKAVRTGFPHMNRIHAPRIGSLPDKGARKDHT